MFDLIGIGPDIQSFDRERGLVSEEWFIQPLDTTHSCAVTYSPFCYEPHTFEITVSYEIDDWMLEEIARRQEAANIFDGEGETLFHQAFEVSYYGGYITGFVLVNFVFTGGAGSAALTAKIGGRAGKIVGQMGKFLADPLSAAGKVAGPLKGVGKTMRNTLGKVFGDAHRVVGGALDDIISKWSKSGSAFATKMKNKLKKFGWRDEGIANAGKMRGLICKTSLPKICFPLPKDWEKGLTDVYGAEKGARMTKNFNLLSEELADNPDAIAGLRRFGNKNIKGSMERYFKETDNAIKRQIQESLQGHEAHLRVMAEAPEFARKDIIAIERELKNAAGKTRIDFELTGKRYGHVTLRNFDDAGELKSLRVLLADNPSEVLYYVRSNQVSAATNYFKDIDPRIKVYPIPGW